jgi:hypothetical protein
VILSDDFIERSRAITAGKDGISHDLLFTILDWRIAIVKHDPDSRRRVECSSWARGRPVDRAAAVRHSNTMNKWRVQLAVSIALTLFSLAASGGETSPATQESGDMKPVPRY